MPPSTEPRRPTMPILDHVVVVAPSLADGVTHIRHSLGIDIPYGGAHPEMGTHNHLLRLGDDLFLEVIAVDPAAKPPAGPRWFGLDDVVAVGAAWAGGAKLRGWVARTDDLDGVLARHGDLLGRKTPVSRGDRSWLFSVRPDGALPGGGLLPCLLDWGERGSPAPAMPQLGASLVAFEVEHPNPQQPAALYRQIGIHDAPAIRRGSHTARYRALIRTPAGIRELR